MELPDTLIEYKGRLYPKFQTKGNSCRFIAPTALEFCKGKGIDFGYNKPEWILPGAIGIEESHHFLIDGYLKKEYQDLDFVFSSHCLEHLDSWVDAIHKFTKVLKPRGVLFLYLPSYSQVYWRPWNNTKHKHIIEPLQVVDLLMELNYKYILHSGTDLNSSYTITAYKNEN